MVLGRTYQELEDLRPDEPEVLHYRVTLNANPEHRNGYAYEVCRPSSLRYNVFRSARRLWAEHFHTEQEAESLALQEIKQWQERCSWIVIAEKIDPTDVTQDDQEVKKLIKFIREDTDGTRYQLLNRLSTVDGPNMSYDYRLALAHVLAEQGFYIFPIEMRER